MEATDMQTPDLDARRQRRVESPRVIACCDWG
jgi:hypothetical protein